MKIVLMYLSTIEYNPSSEVHKYPFRHTQEVTASTQQEQVEESSLISSLIAGDIDIDAVRQKLEPSSYQKIKQEVLSSTNLIQAIKDVEVKRSTVQGVKNLLILAENVNDTAITGETALHIASERGYSDIVTLLVEKGAHINAQDSLKRTPLFLASQQGNVSIVRLLLDKGADYSLATETQQTPLSIAFEKGYDKIVHLFLQRRLIPVGKEILNKGLFIAVGQGNYTMTKLLLDAGACSDVKTILEDSPLHKAVYHGHLTVVTLLLERGGTVNVYDSTSHTPLHYAAQRGYYDIVKVLLNHGAYIHAQSYDSKTPLHYAAQEGNTKVVKLLLKWGASPSYKDWNGRTAFDLARLHGRAAVQALLNGYAS
jgi:ankyrin repeat protein